MTLRVFIVTRQLGTCDTTRSIPADCGSRGRGTKSDFGTSVCLHPSMLTLASLRVVRRISWAVEFDNVAMIQKRSSTREEAMSDHRLRRRDFIYRTLLSGSAAIGAGGLCTADDRIPTLGQGDFTYRPVAGWGVLDAKTPVKNCSGIRRVGSFC
jgi:hypothetical protein